MQASCNMLYIKHLLSPRHFSTRKTGTRNSFTRW